MRERRLLGPRDLPVKIPVKIRDCDWQININWAGQPPTDDIVLTAFGEGKMVLLHYGFVSRAVIWTQVGDGKGILATLGFGTDLLEERGFNLPEILNSLRWYVCERILPEPYLSQCCSIAVGPPLQQFPKQ